MRIPNLSVEYFDKKFLHRIGEKIRKVIRIDKNTESMDRGQYVRFCIEVDLSKPLLSKFRLNGRVWIIQYEGLRQICFKCGHLGHKDEQCPKFRVLNGEESSQNINSIVQTQVPKPLEPPKNPEEYGQLGSWMLVQRTPRRVPIRAKGSSTKQAENKEGVNQVQSKQGVEQGEASHRPPKVHKQSTRSSSTQNGSRLAVLEGRPEGEEFARQDMEIEPHSGANLEGVINLENCQANTGSHTQSTEENQGEDNIILEQNTSRQVNGTSDGEFMESMPITVELAATEDPNSKKEDLLITGKLT